MNTFLASLVSAWGGALLSFLWQGLLIGIVTAFLLGLSRQARPQVRYAIASLALVLCFALPIISVWRSLSVDTFSDAGISTLQTLTGVSGVISTTLSANAVSDALDGWMLWIVIAWSLGCAFFSLRMAMGLTWIANARRHSLVDTDGALQSKLNLLAIQFDVRRPVHLLICDGIDGPVTAGWWKPIVLVPAALLMRLPPDCIEALFAHELAHIKRHDYLVNLIQSFIEAVLFFHPAVWWLSKQIRIERENIADDLAAEVLGEPRQLAVALAALDEFQLAGPLLAPAAHGGNLMSRIQRLIKPTEHVLSWKMSAILIGLTLACITVYAHEKTSTTLTTGTAVNVVDVAEAADAIEPGEAAEVTGADVAVESVSASEADEADPVIEAGDAVEVDDTDDADDVTIKNMPRHETYALVSSSKDGIMMSGSSDDIATIEKAKQTVAGEFLWFLRDGKAYVVQDPAVLAEVKAAWSDSEKLGVQMDALGTKMAVHSKVMDGIGVRMEAVSKGSDGRNEVMEKTGQQMEALGKQQETLGQQMALISQKMASAKTDAEHEAIERDMRVQEAKMASLTRQMERLSEVMQQHGLQLENALKPLEALSKEMEIASRPMHVLGQQMEVLGRQQEALTREADKKVLNIIDSSLKNGHARPAKNSAL